MKIGPSPKQMYAIGAAQGRVNIWQGSIRSGKTWSSIIRFAAAVATKTGPGEILITGKNLDSIYRNLFSPILTEPTLAFLAPNTSYRQGASTATMFGKTIHIVGANDYRAESRLRGITIALAYADEITVLPENFFSQLLGRMSPPGAQLFGTTNPDSPAHWLKTNYLDRVDRLKDWNVFHFTLDDNPALTDEYKTAIKAEYTGLWYDRFILGKWVSADGAVYDMWDPDTMVTPWDNLPEMVETYAIGVDYGTTNPTAALTLSLGTDGRLYLTDEWRIDTGNRTRAWTDAELSDGLITWAATAHTPHENTPPARWIIVDPAAASFKAQLHHDGARNVQDGNNNVLYGIRLVASLLANDRLKIADRCTGLIKEIPGYVWDAKATDQGTDRPIKHDDHSLDAARYAIATTEPLWRGRLRRKE
ncbi:phage terminase large subunit [Actinobaculum suis]|uniref:Phage terminase large subunit n=1 Tax=Actinobaculum suis TaxID=1657 RepID=A0A7Z8Y8J7_9ACTO|nr:PBSX family phage terminase large subunit [Actinobaculum suis]VDG76174.1 phage terminase large subunit [Actinobaculum suis]